MHDRTATITCFPTGRPAPFVLTDLDVLELLQHATGDELAAARAGDADATSKLQKRLSRLERGVTGLRHFRCGRSNRYALSEVLAYVERQTELER